MKYSLSELACGYDLERIYMQQSQPLFPRKDKRQTESETTKAK